MKNKLSIVLNSLGILIMIISIAFNVELIFANRAVGLAIVDGLLSLIILIVCVCDLMKALEGKNE
jgi:uncharacterized membrane protein YkgB